MPATVNVSLTKSRWPMGVHCIGWLLFSIVLAQFIGLLAFVVWFMAFASYGFFKPMPISRLSWQMDKLTFGFKHDESEWQWTGRGRRSSQFILWHLKSEQGKERFVVWKDQVSDSSWRALNMAFTVWQSQALQANALLKTTP